MTNIKMVFQELIHDIDDQELKDIVNNIDQLRPMSLLTLDMIDKELIHEIKSIVENNKVNKEISLLLGKTLRDIKFVIRDIDENEHEIIVKYNGPKKLVISSDDLPESVLLHKEYHTLHDIFTEYSNYINSILPYIRALRKIDINFEVMEPATPSFKKKYRKIRLDDRIWLHLEITLEGLARSINFVGHNKPVQWDHTIDIVENIRKIASMVESSEASQKLTSKGAEPSMVLPTCAICLISDLPGFVGVPQPICRNPQCGSYYHDFCLYENLVKNSNQRPVFGLATGECPMCQLIITCSERRQ